MEERGKNEITNLWELNGGGGGDDTVAEDLGHQRQQAILVGNFPLPEGLERAAEIHPEEHHG